MACPWWETGVESALILPGCAASSESAPSSETESDDVRPADGEKDASRERLGMITN